MDRDREFERQDLLDRLVAAYADRRTRGEDPQGEAAMAQHPELAHELARCFRMVDAGFQVPPPSMTVAAGTRLGEFTIVREVGRGAMGVVYLAEQESLGRRVALKSCDTT